MPVTDSNFDKVEAGPVSSENGWKPLAELDTGPWGSVSYTLRAEDNPVDWRVFGAHEADYSDEMKVQETATVGAGECDDYSTAPPPYRYYRVKVKSTNPNEHGSVVVVGMARAG